ncbi:MAG: hypothetical protein DIU78_007775 [Pseudomonadota bacterium]|nr:MAG: hypothetical protein DIU78_14820 [Pseudomonadota bacterium]
MTTPRRPARERGLPSLNAARQERRRAIVLGRARMPAVPMHFWIWTAVGIAAFAIVYWRIAQAEVEAARSRVLAKQRAMAVALGPKLYPFRDRIEGWARELAAPWTGDFVAEGVPLAKLRAGPSVYLRLRLEDASDPKRLRKAARSSLRDGFTSCLFVGSKRTDPTVGPACRTAGDCSPGKLCNEWNVCVDPEQPYNLRLAYRTLRVLSSDWTDEVHQAPSELSLVAYERDLDNVARVDVPVTAQVLQRSRYFALVLDEDPADGLPPEVGEGGETPLERVQRVPHMARVGIWDLERNEPVLRLRTEAAGELVQVGSGPVRDPENVAAQRRQANSCALALEVRKALEQRSGAQAEATPGGEVSSAQQ